MSGTMTAAYLPGNSSVEMRVVPVPTPGHGEVLLRIKASTICGSDIRCIYHEHLGKGPEGYQPGMIAGHEPSGQIVKVGPGCREFRENDRVDTRRRPALVRTGLEGHVGCAAPHAIIDAIGQVLLRLFEGDDFRVVEKVVLMPALADDLAGFARERLANYKVPRQVETATVLPTNASGKVLKRELRERYAPPV